MSNSSLLAGFPSGWFCEAPESYKCGICMDILNNPHQCKNGHCFCLTCFTTSLEINRECPTCKTYVDVDRLSKSLLVRDAIHVLLTKCHIQDVEGTTSEVCDWTGHLEKRSVHLNSCGFQLVKCPVSSFVGSCKNCTGNVLKKDLDAHVKNICGADICSMLEQLKRAKAALVVRTQSVPRPSLLHGIFTVKDGNMTYSGRHLLLPLVILNLN
jgi:hypothetical protein